MAAKFWASPPQWVPSVLRELIKNNVNSDVHGRAKAAPAPPADLQSASARFLRWYMATVVVSLAVILAFVGWANPWRNFGDVGLPHYYNARRAKLTHIGAMPAAKRPEVLVLGSSNVMRYDPKKLERELGKTAFNHGVYYGKAEDFLCTVRHYVEDLNYVPKLLVIGLDTWTLRRGGSEHPIFPGMRREHLNVERLVRHNPDVNVAKLWMSRLLDTVYAQQIALSWRLWRKGAKRTPEAALGEEGSGFSPAGLRLNYGSLYGDTTKDMFADVEAGKDVLSGQLKAISDSGRYREFATLHTYDFDGLAENRVSYIDQMLSICDAKGIQVVFVINPVHPTFWDALLAHTSHADNLRLLNKQIAAWQGPHKSLLGVFDGSELASFDGDPTGFFDEIHTATRNCDKLIEKIAQVVRSAK